MLARAQPRLQGSLDVLIESMHSSAFVHVCETAIASVHRCCTRVQRAGAGRGAGAEAWDTAAPVTKLDMSRALCVLVRRFVCACV